MAEVFLEGFDFWSSVPQSTSPGTNDFVAFTALPQPGVSTSPVAFADTASQSLHLTINASQQQAVWAAVPAQTQYIAGFWFQYQGTLSFSITTGPGSTVPILTLGTISGVTITPNMMLCIDSSGVLHLTSNLTDNVTFASGTTALVSGEWYFIEVQSTLSSSISANTCFVRLNGSTEINVTTGASTYTASTTGKSTSLVGLGFDALTTSGTINVYFDDFYLFDLTGSTNNTPFGPEHVHSVAPSTQTLVPKGNLWYAAAASSANFTGLAATIGAKPVAASDSANFTATASAPLQIGFTDILGSRGIHLGNFVLAFGAQEPIYGAASDSATFTGTASAVLTGSLPVSVSSLATFTGVARAVLLGDIAVSASDSANFTGIAAGFDSSSPAHAWYVSASDSAVFSASPGISSFHGHASDSATFADQALTGTSDQASANTSGKFSDSAAGWVPQIRRQSVHDSFYFLEVLPAVHNTAVQVSASDSATFTGTASETAWVHLKASASDSATFTDAASEGTLNVWRVSASDSANFTDTAITPGIWTRVTSDSASFIGVASETRVTATQASSDSANFSDVAESGVVRPAAASDSANFTGLAKSNNFWTAAASDSANFTGLASEVTLKLGGYDSANFSDLADVAILLPSGAIVPGGDQQLGLRTVLMGSLSSEYPFTYAQSPDGLVLLANGMDMMIAWDGLQPAAWCAGLNAPSSVVWLDGSGTGSILGRRYAYVRFVDERNNVSNLGPVSDPLELGTDGFIEGATYSPSGVVTILSRCHGLTTGTGVVISSVGGLAAVNGTYAITVVDADNFTLAGLVVTGGRYTSGGTWTAGVSAITYSNVPTSADPKVARRQILRNLLGDASVFYVDIDTADRTSTSFTSEQTDEQLATCCAVPVRFTDRDNATDRFFQGGFPASQRHGVPPSFKRSLASYAGRIFAAADLVYSDGNVQVSLGSTEVLGLGSGWTGSFVGRLLYVEGGSDSVVVESVDVANQIITLETPYNGPSQTFGFYTIRPAPVERQLVYYSESNLPESWPTWNAFAVPETEDEIVGLMVQGSFLYILKERNLFKFSYKNDPGRDGYMFPVARRGCINARTWVYIEGKSYVLDEQGVYAFDGDQIEHISGAVQSLFKPDGLSQYRVDWTTDRTFWHASLDPQRETIRWYVDMVGFPSLTYAVCYNFRRQQWWLEQFAERVTSSTTAVVNGRQQGIVGTTGRRVLCFGQGTLDLIQETVTGTLRGSVTSSTSATLVDTNASFPSNLAGVTVTLITGAGAGQQAIISSSTSATLSVLNLWNVSPGVGDEYQIGGVNWLWKSGWRRIVDDEASNPRDIEVVFAPTTHAGTFDLSLYYDHSSTPFAGWGYSQERDGIRIVEDSPNVIVSTFTPRGYAIQRMSGHRDPYGYGHRYVALELHGTQAVDPTRVYQVVINGAM